MHSLSFEDATNLAITLQKAESEISRIVGAKVKLRYNFSFSIIDDVDELIIIIADALGLSVTDIVKQCREEEVLEARQLMMYYISLYFPKATLKKIAEKVGLTHHTTCLHAIKKIKDLIDANDIHILQKMSIIEDAIKTYCQPHNTTSHE